MKKLLTLFLCACITVSLIGCYGEPAATTEATVTKPVEATEGNGSAALEVYYLDETVSTARYIVQRFKQHYPDIALNATAFNNIEEMDQRIAEEMAAGEGPDVILFPDTTTVDTTKLALTDRFMDLSGFLAEDDTYDSQNYYPVLDAGMFGGRQCLMPLRMRFMFMMTSRDRFSNALGLTEQYTLEQLMEALTTNAEQCPTGENAMFTMHNFNRYLYDLIRLTGTEIIDPDALAQVISEEGLYAYTQFAQTAYSQCLEAAKQMSEYGNGNLGQMLRRNTVILSNMSLLTNSRYYGEIYSQVFEEDIRVLTYPDLLEPEALTVDISLYAAVLNTTDKPYEAYAFVRSAMDADFGNLNEQLPVSKTGTSELLAYLRNATGKRVTVESVVVMVSGMSEEQKEMCEEILARITAGSIPNAGLAKIFADTMHPAMHGETDFESCYRDFQEELELYLNELYE